MSTIQKRLRELGIVLPDAVRPVANYLGCKRSGDLLFVSGRVSELRGCVGRDCDVDAAYKAARDTALVMLASVQDEIGDLDLIAGIEMVQGFVRSAEDFTEQPRVIDGASDILIEIFGESGRHARTATGVAQLPFGAAVQLTMIFRLHS